MTYADQRPPQLDTLPTFPDVSPMPPGNRARRRPPRAVIAGIPVFAVNLCAFFGQFAFLHDHLHWWIGGVVLVALTLESIAVYIAYHAHVAQSQDDPSFRLRLAAELFALVIATLNYSHYAGPHWRPTFAAVTFALFSAISPWLWGIHSHRESRDMLKARGLIDAHAVRLGATRWLWHPWKCARVMWMATWEGIDKPSVAIATWESRRAASRAAAEFPAVEINTAYLQAMTAKERLTWAFGAIGAIDVPRACRLLESLEAKIDDSTARKHRAALEATALATTTEETPAS